MLTNEDITCLIKRSKKIVKKTPVKGYRCHKQQRRCDLELVDIEDERYKYGVFIRQNTNFIENFSIGLVHTPINYPIRRLTLVRYNGCHGEYSINPDGHYAVPHIHRITTTEICSGSSQPQESRREITDKYFTYESALRVFWQDIGVRDETEINKHFPNLMQSTMFDE